MMMERKSTFQCQLCGNIVELLHVGGGTLSCCGQDMKLLEESTADTSLEKHVPFIEKTDKGYIVKVGQNQDHPMMETHYIQWIELHTESTEYRLYLKPENEPEAEYPIGHNEIITGAREFCNLHGLWKGSI
jgi:superoxide reductase